MRTLPRLALAGILVAGPLAGCGATGTAHLVVTQSTDAALNSADHLGHMAPATFAGITISIKNIGTGPIRGLTVTDMLPAGFHFYQVTTVTGNAIRTGTQDPSGPANPTWGLWTLPAPTSGKDSQLVLSFKVQVATKPGSYDNTLRISGVNSGAIDQSPLTLVVEPRPSLTVATAAATGQVVTGGTATYVITVANVGSAVAKGVAASVSLPGGFLYLSTTGFENDSIDAAQRVTVTDSLPSDLTFANTNSVTINGAPVGSNLVPAPGGATPQWGPFTIPAGGFGGSILVITFTARVSGSATLGPHPNVVSGSSSNAQIGRASCRERV